MKQTWTAVLLVILATVPALAAVITVTAPAAGASLEIDAIKPVTWTFTGLANTTKVRIVLWRNGSSLGTIAEDQAIGSNGQGSYSWKVGAYAGGPAVAGPGYRIRVRTMDNAVSAFGDIFALSDKPGNTGGPIILPPGPRTAPKFGQTSACMVITSPKAGDSVDPVNIVEVNWTKNGTLDANVSITLQRAGKGAMFPGVTLAASAPNNGGFNWDPVPVNPNPGVYRIKVKTLDGKCEALSAEFTMKEQGGIELLSPKGGEVWENGTSHAVTWKRGGNIQSVDILLNREGSWTHTIAQGVDAKLGTKTCTFVRGDTDGANPICYKVFINHNGGGSSNMSGCITITGNPDLAVSASFTPTLANVGTNLTFTIKIENKGSAGSKACQGEFKVNGVVQQTFPIPAIPPGATATISPIWKLACPVTITIQVDSGNVNIESDKTNNVWEKPMC